MLIRKAMIKDLDEIHKLNMKLVTEGYALSKLKNPKTIEKIYYNYYRKMFKNKNSLFLVAEEEGKIIGYCLGEIFRPKKVCKYEIAGYISDMYILKGYRKMGIGQELVKELMKWFRSRKIRWVKLHVDVHNKDSISFWRKMEFKDFMIEMDTLLK